MTQDIPQNLAKLTERIRAAAQQCQRDPADITLLAASKAQSANAIAAAAAAGIAHVGENYLQEALEKQARLGDLPLTWHYIGPIQSNKTRSIAEHFDWVHSVDRLKIARRLAGQRPPHLPPLQVCLQVNISGEGSKSGATPEELPALAGAIADLDQLQLRGLMAIPAPTASDAEQHAAFAALRQLMEGLRERLPALDTLSMGMSADLEAAIAEGSTIIRVGTGIFGPRGE